MKKSTKKMIQEIYNTISPKLFNISNNTASEREIQVVREALAYISLLKYSCLNEAEIKQLWDESNLAYM